VKAAIWSLGERASALIAAGRPSAALPLLSRCAAAGAGWALLLRGRAKAALGRPSLAEADVTRAFDLDPDCGWIFGLSVGPLTIPAEGGRLFASNRSFHDAKACYAARAFHGKLAIMAGKKDEGLAHLDWAAKAAPKRPYLFSWRGEARRRLGDLAGARADARRALALDPRYAVAWTTLAAVERQSGRPAAALEAARRAARCGPWYENAPLEAARACLALGDIRGVLTWLERAARRSSRLGWTNLGEGRVSPAPDPETLLRDTPWRGSLLAWCGEFLVSRGEHARALDFLDAPHPFAATWRGEARLALGDASGAEKDLRTAVRRAPRYARAWAALASARLELGRPRPALAACDRALSLEPDWAWALYQRGRVLGALGKKAAALRDLDACLALDRRFEAARLERALLT
jgi:tetratricopeptide (TPR) repeat protein